MNVSNLLSHDIPPTINTLSTSVGAQQHLQRAHQYPTRQSLSTTPQDYNHEGNGSPTRQRDFHETDRLVYDGLPSAPLPKNVAFELLFDGAHTRARLPMRVQIFPHDTTDSIITTVKNFYGLYDGTATGVSFEDEQGNTLIARYENLKNNMVVYVRVIPDFVQPSLQHGPLGWPSASPISPDRVLQLDDAFQMPPPAQLNHLTNYEQPPSRPCSRLAHKRSVSPRNNHGRRSMSTQKHHSRSGVKSRDTSLPRNGEELNSDAFNVNSDSDGGAGSVTSSRKARSELLASAEISVDNIVEGGRRKRAKFESSELPLFVPPQVPAANSISSISPQRRSNGQDNASPFAKPPQRPYGGSQILHSPHVYEHSEYPYGIVTSTSTQNSTPLPAAHGHRLRERSNASRLSYQGSSGGIARPQAFGILPTPDPTVASCISDEDVALQLMRLGDASNISHGRTSASTLDDALSGRADMASSATSESNYESDPAERPRLDSSRLSSNHAPGCRLSGNSTEYQYDQVDGRRSTVQSNGYNDHEVGEDQDSVERGAVIKRDPDESIDRPGESKRGKLAGSKTVYDGIAKPRNSLSSKILKPPKQRSATSHKKSKVPTFPTESKMPLSPASLANQSRKNSAASTLNFQHHLGADEEDLSSKPRCQRCRKSKKGCDRQRPCQRCKDAGIGIEGCVSEDEGNGRKGRFGRHMGVSVKKDTLNPMEFEAAGAILTGMASGLEKNKKRKRTAQTMSQSSATINLPTFVHESQVSEDTYAPALVTEWQA
ncbi:MAG: hypothetical protein Q9220_000703 [cf. Caloplaca sp. 1 TL-2023]